MGCQHSTIAQQVSEEYGKPKPRIFQLIRIGHEVIRGSQQEMRDCIEQEEFVGALDIWTKLLKWQAVYRKMELGDGKEGGTKGLFRLLDEKFDGVASDAMLHLMHDELREKEVALDRALRNKAISEIGLAFDEYTALNLSHLTKVEGVMMPKVSQLRREEGHDQLAVYMRRDILTTVLTKDRDTALFQFFVQYANVVLERHADGKPWVRVWDHALWTIAKKVEWAVWEGWIKEVVQPETYQEVFDAVNA